VQTVTDVFGYVKKINELMLKDSKATGWAWHLYLRELSVGCHSL